MGYSSIENVGNFFIKLDFNLKEASTTLEVKQYDNCMIRAALLMNNYHLDDYTYPSECNFVLRIKRPDGKVIFNEGILSQESGNTDTVYCSLGRNATMIPGTAYADIALYIPFTQETSELLEQENIEAEQENDFVIVSTQPFLLKIIPSPGLNGDSSVEPPIGEITYNGDTTSVLPVNIFQPFVDLNSILHLTPEV